MQHNIPVQILDTIIGPQITCMVAAIEACVHCGFCLPVCPTYQLLNEESDSPRGRILLMKSVLENEISISDAIQSIDHCLGCLACVTACPSGVQYGELVTPFRAFASKKIQRPIMKRTQEYLLSSTLPYPQRFRRAITIGKLMKPIRNVLPNELQSMLALIPDDQPKSETYPEFIPAQGKRRGKVAFLTGCVQQVVSPDINWATLRVMAINGVDIYIPSDQICCGGLLMHIGDLEGARLQALKNLLVFPDDVDAIITNAAGCGSGMKEYGFLFNGQREEGDANKFSSLVMDASEYLVNIGMITPPPMGSPVSVAYHDACHMLHAQKIKDQPREILEQIPNINLVDIEKGDTCCGSAGTYNIEQPDIAKELGNTKAENILRSGADMVVTGNIGCIIQIQMYLEGNLPVLHIMQILDQAYQER